jgi:hypothetical protein
MYRILIKRKKTKLIKRKRCQFILDDGLFSGEEKTCENYVSRPNKYLCNLHLRMAESLEQTLGVEK